MRACIFGAGDYRGEGLSYCENALIIAADGGLSYCRQQGLTPSLTVGDFDSLGYLPDGITVIRHPVEKDDTDMALAADEAISRGADEILLFGALGGRLDHTLANITLLRSLSERKITAYIVGAREVLTVVTGGEVLTFEGLPDGVFSLFSLTDRATVSLSGLQYPLDRFDISADRALGVSNHFLKKPATVSVHGGEALVVFERENASFPRRSPA